jgi:hopanoid C-3 methylase
VKILLVRPAPHRDSVGLQSFMVCEPLELEYAAAAAKGEGHVVVLADLIFERRPFSRILSEERPDIVAFTSYIVHVGVVKELAREVRRHDPLIATVVGGVHAEVVPRDFEDESLDFVLHSRALEAWSLLLRNLSGAPGERSSFAAWRRDIPGMWDGPGKCYDANPLVPMVHPDRSLSEKWRHRYDYIFHSRCALLKTSMGCAYGCEFCFCIRIARRKLVERPLPDVIEEIEEISESNVFVVDDNFLFRPERVLEFCERLDAAGIEKRFLVFGRADFVVQHPEVVERFKRSGLTAVFMGLESFREQELSEMDKRVDVETNARAVAILAGLDIECHAGIIVGPDWGPHDFAHLCRWLDRLGRPYVNIQPLTPMPGTPLFERMKESIVVPRDRHEFWDMTHLVVEPTRLTRRAFQWNIVKAYYRTTTGLSSHFRILRRYGWSVYLRTARGSLHLTRQYLRMIRNGT